MTKTTCEETIAVQMKTNNKSHMPENSLFFEKIIPALLIALCIVTAGLALFAVGVLLGIVNF